MPALNALIKPHNALLAMQYLADYQCASNTQPFAANDTKFILKLVDLKRASTPQEIIQAVQNWLPHLPLEAQQQLADWLIKHS